MSAPVLDASLVVKRLGILYMYDLPDGTKELLWCLCEVLLVKERGARDTVRWDANEQHGELESLEGE
eukprot:4751133-Pleurochrysis_carterae.AAC.1